MKNDQKIVKLAKEAISQLQGVVSFWNGFGNLCASTDRSIEKAIELVEEIKELHKENFQEDV